MELRDFLSRLTVSHGGRPSAKGEYSCRCPAHDDKTASLCVSEGEKGIVLKCHAGCSAEAVVRAMGLTMRDLFSADEKSKGTEKKPKGGAGKKQTAAPRQYFSYQTAYGFLGEVQAVYPYADEQGKVLYEVARIKTEKGKTFRQHRRAEADKQFPIICGLPEGVRLVLYKLPDVQDAIREGKTIYVVEGEKDADNMAALGYSATTSAGGANKWGNGQYGKMLRGADVVLIPDNDVPGRRHMEAVGRDLVNYCQRVRMIDLAATWEDIPQKADVSDLFATFGRAEGERRLAALVEAAEPYKVDENAMRKKEAAEQYEAIPGYCIKSGRTCQIGNDGVEKPLANFVAVPRAVVARDDGVNVTKEMVIDGWDRHGRPLPRVQIKANQFNAMNWVAEQWDFAANILPGSTTKDKLRYVISEVGNVTAKAITEYTHTGWRRIGGRWAYLYQGGAIGTEGVTVDLGSGLNAYRLDGDGDAEFAEIKTQEAAMNTMVLRNLMPASIGVPLLATIFLAPLREFLSQTGVAPAYALFLLGGTGTRKSTILALALSHFGNFSAKSLPASFNDTANFIRKKAFSLKDAPLVVDDYHPVTNLQERKKMEATAQALARAFGDGAERGRMKSDLTLQESMPPRGVAIISGEDSPGVGESGIARFYVVNIRKGDIPANSQLTAMQELARKGYLQKSMRGYIEWLLEQADDLPDKLHEKFISNRALALERTVGQHGRTAEAIAHMMIGYDMLLQFAVSIGLMDEDERARQAEAAWDVLCEASRKQSEEMVEERPTKIFLSMLGELMQSRAIGVRDLTAGEHGSPTGAGREMVGYCDKEYYYLMPQVAYKAVARLCSEQGQAFPLTPKMLYKQLREDGVLTPGTTTENSSTKPKWIDGKPQRLLWIPRVAMDGPESSYAQEGFLPADDADNPF